LAIAALDHLEIEPGLLYLAAGRRGADAFDGGDGAVAHRAHRQHAGAHRLAVDMHRAGSALGNAAAEFRTGHAEYVTENPEQRHVGRGVERLWFAVDGQFCDRQFFHGETRCAEAMPASILRLVPCPFCRVLAVSDVQKNMGRAAGY
jgi:hypothetical protein